MDEKGDGVLYNPVNDECIDLQNFPHGTKGVLWDNWIPDKVCKIFHFVCECTHVHMYVRTVCMYVCVYIRTFICTIKFRFGIIVVNFACNGLLEMSTVVFHSASLIGAVFLSAILAKDGLLNSCLVDQSARISITKSTQFTVVNFAVAKVLCVLSDLYSEIPL